MSRNVRGSAAAAAMADDRDSDNEESIPDEYDAVETQNLGEVLDTQRATFELITHYHDLDSSDITSLCVQNEVMAILGGNTVIIRDMDGGEEPYKTTIANDGYRIFLDLTGKHCFVSTRANDLFYINPSLRVKQRVTLAPAVANATAGLLAPIGVPLGLNAVAGAGFSGPVSCVGWDKNACNEANTGKILLGTRGGQIIEAQIVVESRGTVRAELAVVAELSGLELTSIEVEQLNSRTFAAFVTTANRLFRFMGPTFSAMFEPVKRGATPTAIVDHPSNNDASLRGTFTVYRAAPAAAPHAYLWANTTGLRHGLFNAQPSSVDIANAAGRRGSVLASAPQFDGCDDDTAAAVLPPSQLQSARTWANFAGESTSVTCNDQRILMSRRPGTGVGGAAGAGAGVGGAAAAAASGFPFDKPPIDASCSAYHMFVVWEDRLIVIAHPAGMKWFPRANPALNNESSIVSAVSDPDVRDTDLIERVRFDPFKARRINPKLRGIVRDVSKRKLYVYNDKQIFQIDIKRETAGQWKLFLSQAVFYDLPLDIKTRYFMSAATLAGRNRVAKDAVQFAMGRFYLEQRCDVDAATTAFSQCRRFEAIFNYLLAYDQRASKSGKRIALQQFVEKRLQQMLKREVSAGKSMLTQLACLTALLVELRLDTLSAEMREEAISLNQATAASTRSAAVSTNPRALKDQLAAKAAQIDRKRQEKEQPLYDSLSSLNTGLPKTVTGDDPFYQLLSRLISSHGCIELMLKFAELMMRAEFTIAYNINRAKWSASCEALISRCTPKATDRPEEREAMLNVWYKYAPTLISRCPNQLINRGLVRLFSKLGNGRSDPMVDPERLIPAFVCYDVSMNAAEDSAYATRDASDHLVIGYLKKIVKETLIDSEATYHLLLSLMLQTHDSELASLIDQLSSYKPEYALRQCLEYHKLALCVPLFVKLGLIEDAVSAAIEVQDAETAKRIARQASDDPLADKTMLKHIWLTIAQATVKGDAKAGLRIIDESKGVLRLEDVISTLDNETWVISEFKEAICASLGQHAETIKRLKENMEVATTTAESIKLQERVMQNQFGYVATTQRCVLCSVALLRGKGFLAYPACRHAFHEECVVRLYERATESRKRVVAKATGLDAELRGAEPRSEMLAEVECPLCGEYAIQEVGDPLVTEISLSTWEL